MSVRKKVKFKNNLQDVLKLFLLLLFTSIYLLTHSIQMTALITLPIFLLIIGILYYKKTDNDNKNEQTMR
ncbi:hypothetical protein ACSVDA_22705 [Cytobacillus sp. Hm23]|uniref:hypothetical protein n=1 Tax=Cytobacillus sp. IB215665 TaxID=3097357 RepID=UPI002A11ACC8|nr:hypothetical protein [Cytobacillus sp. IB215665]MDX8366420.1 hypothetical protein [Cytobacillus sp. IB215665]